MAKKGYKGIYPDPIPGPGELVTPSGTRLERSARPTGITVPAMARRCRCGMDGCRSAEVKASVGMTDSLMSLPDAVYVAEAVTGYQEAVRLLSDLVREVHTGDFSNLRDMAAYRKAREFLDG